MCSRSAQSTNKEVCQAPLNELLATADIYDCAGVFRQSANRLLACSRFALSRLLLGWVFSILQPVRCAPASARRRLLPDHSTITTLGTKNGYLLLVWHTTCMFFQKSAGGGVK